MKTIAYILAIPLFLFIIALLIDPSVSVLLATALLSGAGIRKLHREQRKEKPCAGMNASCTEFTLPSDHIYEKGGS